MPQRQGQRYKGTSPFRDLDLDRKTFFGRDDEKRTLLSLVLAENLVVLFSKSGMGKSSLVNAGLLKPLRDQGYFPMVVRVNDRRAGPLRSVFDGIAAAVKEARVESVNGDETSAWHFFMNAEFWSENNDLLRPVLILDQFEELFTLQTPTRQRDFIRELAELVRGRQPRPDDATPELAGGGPPALKVLLAVREDFLANLEELAPAIPGILHNRFRLGPLTKQGAREAIMEPARIADPAFETDPFSYREEAVTEMISFLCKRRQGSEIVETEEVEPVQLQLICQYVEERVKSRQASEAAGIEVSDKDLGGEQRMRAVLEGFYDRTIQAIQPRSEARAARRLCETRLISPSGRRLTEDQEEIERKFGIPKSRLQLLVDARLLRAEPRLGGTFYELSHDTLVRPILESRKRRRARRLRIAVIGAPVATALLTALVFYFFLPFYFDRVFGGQYPGTSRLSGREGLNYVWIPPGTFEMGCSTKDTACYSDEVPRHRVTLSKGFWIGQTEVTVEAYTRFVAAGHRSPPPPAFKQSASHPVVNVSWNDAAAYCQWAGGRLPTEAEWEYAARAGSAEARYGVIDEIAWYADNSGGDRLDSATLWKDTQNVDKYLEKLRVNENRTHAVGQKKPNAWGLYDMLGNVWEWTADGYAEDYYRRSPERDPKGPDPPGDLRVLRGGSWVFGPWVVRASSRGRSGPEGRGDGAGFRCAREVAP
jgi:formylglycine-generating enzyme required for sulfatase activity